MLKLLGLAGVNCVLALILTSSFLTHVSTVPKLTEDHITTFIREMNDISSGARADMDRFNVTSYFMKHVDDDSEYVDTVKFDLPQLQVPPQERTLKMSKLDYISHVLQEMDSAGVRRTQVDIENIEIADNGREATVVTVNRGSGMLPLQDNSGGSTMVPVIGTSFCEQTLALRREDIVVQKTNCSTDLNIDDGSGE
jgi:hypothetical protein